MELHKTFIVLLALLLAVMVPMVSAEDNTSSNEITKNRLMKQLDEQVADYNQAVTEQNLEKIRKSVERIDGTIERLSGIGDLAVFSSTSQMTKGPEDQDIPTTITFAVREKTQADLDKERSFTANEKQLQIYNQLDIENISTGESLEKVFFLMQWWVCPKVR